MRSDDERLRDILEAIERIEKHTLRGREAFDQDELIQNWVVSHLRIIGEACRSLSDPIRRLHTDVPWSEIIGMRNILVHHYFEVDQEIVWKVVENDLPNLKVKIDKIISG